MDILVIGSNGTVGAPLVKALRKCGHTVFTSDSKHAFDQIDEHGYDTYIRCDISSYRQLERLLLTRRYDYVYFLAAEFGRINGEEYYELVWKTNVIGTKNLLEIVSYMVDQPKIIFTSSSEVYGELQTENGFLNEDDIIHNAFKLSNDYAISKYVNEMQIVNAIKRYNLPIMTIRLFNAYGPGEYYNSYRSVVCLFCYKLLHDMPITIFKNYHRVFMYIDDLIRTLSDIPSAEWESLDKRTFNIGGTEYCSVEHMYEVIKKHIPNSKSAVTILPEDKHNTVNKRPDIARAQKYLNHNPKIELEEGIPLTLDWMKKVYAD